MRDFLLLARLAASLLSSPVSSQQLPDVKAFLQEVRSGTQESASAGAPSSGGTPAAGPTRSVELHDMYSNPFFASQDLQLFENVVETVEKAYADPIPHDATLMRIIKAIAEVDPYSEFYTNEELTHYRHYMRGQLGDVGLQLDKNHKRGPFKIVRVEPGSPAQQAGIKPGYALLKVQGLDVTQSGLAYVHSVVSGPIDSSVTLEVAPGMSRKAAKTPFLRTLVRKERDIPITYADLDRGSGVGYLYVSRFLDKDPGNPQSKDTCDEALPALRDLKKRGMTSLIIDLRGNPGGDMLCAMKFAGFFLDPGAKISSFKDRYGRTAEYFVIRGSQGSSKMVSATEQNLYVANDGVGEFKDNLPLTLLVSRKTASAAETFAAAIRDYKRGAIMGSCTFGKDLVQRVFPVPEVGALNVTIAHWFTPSGNSIHRDRPKDGPPSGVGGVCPDPGGEIGLADDVEAMIVDRTDRRMNALEEIKEEERIHDPLLERLAPRVEAKFRRRRIPVLSAIF